MTTIFNKHTFLPCSLFAFGTLAGTSCAPLPPQRTLAISGADRAHIVGNPGPLFGPSFYPLEAARLKQEGAVNLELLVGPDGSVSGCTVTKTSGFTSLDERACTQARKIRFTPAHDDVGTKLESVYPITVTWHLPS